MKVVEPIRDIEKLRDMQIYLKKKSQRDYVMFMLQLYVPIRISDILKLKVRDVRNRERIDLVEQKTGKEQRFILHKDIQKILNDYVKDKDDYEILFKSRKGINQPIKRTRAWAIYKEAGEKVGIKHIGAHSPRKTFGYMHYMKYKDLVSLKETFNHYDIAETRRYIGLNQDIKDKQVKGLSFM